ncbi:MAG: hypothetical protein KC419_16615 [Anaerolineales bacterium]|nr:hypothetical protein [Anaerolineales bacterium]MCA9930109.1 hypothetical protein [Anaerolineales bacterium]
MTFEIIGDIYDIEAIAINQSIHELKRLQRVYGPGRWRKMKGIATIALKNGRIRIAELHWYEASGIGKKRLNVKDIWINR